MVDRNDRGRGNLQSEFAGPGNGELPQAIPVTPGEVIGLATWESETAFISGKATTVLRAQDDQTLKNALARMGIRFYEDPDDGIIQIDNKDTQKIQLLRAQQVLRDNSWDTERAFISGKATPILSVQANDDVRAALETLHIGFIEDASGGRIQIDTADTNRVQSILSPSAPQVQAPKPGPG